MAIPLKKYRIRKNRMMAGAVRGFYAQPETGMCLAEEEHVHLLCLERLDSAVDACVWGRMVIDAELPRDSMLSVCVYASDEDLPVPEMGTKIVDAYDFLLYEQKGRYLWIWLEVLGKGEGVIREILVYTPGDTFMNTFPEIYREHGGFFHRYLSIFSSIYMDFQQKIDALHTYIDLETAPPEALPIIADWLGIEVEDSLLEVETLRALLKESPYLIRYKGTKGAVERIARLILKSEVIIAERVTGRGESSGENLGRLYGTGACDFTILAMREYDETLKNRLICLLEQFKPVRSRANLVFLKKNSSLGGYCYLDINAALHESTVGAIGSGCALDDGSYMGERVPEIKVK